MKHRLLTALIAIAALALAATPAALADNPNKDKDTYVQLLAINDFHGHVESTTPGNIIDSTGANGPAGGAEYLATYVKNARMDNTNTLFVASGDLVGASPLTSALFHDEPTVEAMNLMGLDMSGIGNHEFDEGLDEIYRLMNGGCHPVDGCQDGTPFFGSIYGYLAANVVFEGTNETVLPAYEIRKVDNAKIAFIGLTFENTPLVVVPSSIEGLDFLPEVATVNALVHKLRDENGVRAFVILIHQGGFQNAPFSRGFLDPNGCDNISGDIIPIVQQLDPMVDVVVSGHTHAAYNCRVGDKLLTSASSFGRVLTKIQLRIDHQSKDVVSSSATNVVVRQNVAKDPDETALVNKYKALAAPLANQVLGRITEDLKSTRDGVQNAGGESPLGDVIADGQLEATAPTDFGGAVVALMNPGGIRVPLLYNQISGGEQPGEVTYGEAFNVQPFGNTLTVKTCNGAQIQALLEQQFVVQTPPRFLQVSWTFSYAWDSTRPAGDKVVNSSVKINGVPIVDAQSYQVTMNNFLADGGDGFSVFRQCTNQIGGEVDLDAFGRYLLAHSPVSPPPYLTAPRITKLG